ncbi:hypothetical protein CR513_08684, partial [Mucuna pruriens]
MFRATDESLCEKFSKMMQKEIEMIMMGELKFFLGLQIKQAEVDIYIYQTKYVKELLKKFKLDDCKRSTNLGLWFKQFDKYMLKGYYDVDYVGDIIERKSTIRGYNFIGTNLVSWEITALSFSRSNINLRTTTSMRVTSIYFVIILLLLIFSKISYCILEMAQKVLDCGLYWPTIHQEAHKFVSACEQFGVSKALISDQGSHLCNRALAMLLEKYRVLLQKLANPSRNDWSRLLEDALLLGA